MNFYAPVIEDRGAYCFCPVCHSVTSVILSETLTLLNGKYSGFDISYVCFL